MDFDNIPYYTAFCLSKYICWIFFSAGPLAYCAIEKFFFDKF